MENPFKKNDNSKIVTVLGFAAFTAGTIVYLYLTEGGLKARKAIKHKVKDEAKNVFSGIVSNKTGISKKTIKKVTDHLVK